MQKYRYVVKINFEETFRKIEGTRAEEHDGGLVIYDGEEVVARLSNVENWHWESL
jgi:hypothetical protein